MYGDHACSGAPYLNSIAHVPGRCAPPRASARVVCKPKTSCVAFVLCTRLPLMLGNTRKRWIEKKKRCDPIHTSTNGAQ